jgi:hypothetical protein
VEAAKCLKQDGLLPYGLVAGVVVVVVDVVTKKNEVSLGEDR